MTAPQPSTSAAGVTGQRPRRRARARDVATGAREEPTTAKALFGMLGALVLGAFGLYLGAVQAWPAWQAAHGHGTPGTVTITHVYCHSKGPCERHGTFTSDTGHTVNDVELVGVAADRGDRARVLAESNDPRGARVYGDGWRALTEAGLNLMFGLLFIAGGSAQALERFVIRRRPSTGRHARH